MALRVTLSALLSGTALSGPTRITSHWLVSAIPFAGSKRFSTHLLQSGVAFAGPKRMTGHYLLAAISLATRFDPEYLERRQIYGVSKFAYTLTGYLIPEHNPYRPRIPEQLIAQGEDFYDFFEENQQILREQHNVTQAGDTTFPFQLTGRSHTDQLYKLGAIGRFYHEDFGVLLARYCQFDLMAEVETIHCPVGLFRNKKSLEWVVTNRFDLSDPNLVVGISAPYELPVDGTYGWVIVDGPNLQQVKNTSTTAKIGESLVWSATGAINNSAEGKILGRRVNKLSEKVSSASIMAGQMLIRVESLSEASIQAVISGSIAALQESIAALQTQLGELPAAAELASLNAALTSLTAKVNLEISQRKAADAAIQEQFANLDAITQAELDAALVNVASNLANAAASLQTQINTIRAIAIDALNKANQALDIDLTALQNQINSIQTWISLEIERPKGKFPVVDGSVPPNLVYLDDGSLVYTETF